METESFTLTKKEFENIIKFAFQKGELFGVTYSTWFVPTDDDRKEKIDNAFQEINKRILENK